MRYLRRIAIADQQPPTSRSHMDINHLIIGASDVDRSSAFYCSVFGYVAVATFVDTGTGNTGVVLERPSSPQILIVPFADARLPNPQHVAFQTDRKEFDTLFSRCKELSLPIRAEPVLTSTVSGTGRLSVGSRTFENFYILDPSRVNIELMVEL